MKRKYLVMGLVAGGLLLAGAEAVAAAGATGTGLVSEGISLELGQRDFRNYCAACHGIEGKGDGTLGEFLTLAVPDLTSSPKLNAGKFPEERVTEVIDGRTDVKVHGMRDMPVWGDWFNARPSPRTPTAKRANDRQGPHPVAGRLHQEHSGEVREATCLSGSAPPPAAPRRRCAWTGRT